MKLFLLLILVSCSQREPVVNSVRWLSNGYLCKDADFTHSGVILSGCENALTGQKQVKIYAATNVVKIEQ